MKKVLIYDGTGGQLQAGLGPWGNLAEWKRKSLLESDPQADQKVLSIVEIFKGIDVEWAEVTTYEECLEQIATAHVLVVCKGRIDAQLVDHAHLLQAVHILGEDTRNMALTDLQSKRVDLHFYPFTNFTAVAEHAFAMMLSLVKRLTEADKAVREGSAWMVIPGNIRVIRDLTIGVLGAGEIGQEFLRLAAPWKARLLYHDLQRIPKLEQETAAAFAQWREIFEQCDVISVHLSDSDKLVKSIGANEFSLMKQSALLINTARGKLVDETALIDALSTGKIAGAALDVFEQEPLPVTHPLTAFPNVLLSPHTAWAGPWTLVNDAHRLLRGVADQLRR